MEITKLLEMKQKKHLLLKQNLKDNYCVAM